MEASTAFGYTDPAACLDWLTQADLPRDELQKLAGFLTIGETYFFREKNHFEPMARHLFGEVIDRKRKSGNKQLRIWSAACSTGEEPYSIAILLDAILPDIMEWSIRILATDINPDSLGRAREAVYRPWSFRGTPEWVKQRYFNIENENHAVAPEIKDRVTFDFLNLAEEVYPSHSTQTEAIDVIFCRNVLIYFAPEQARKVISRLQDSLVEDGWLVLSPTETVYVEEPTLHRRVIQEAILYQKSSSKPSAPRSRPFDSKPAQPIFRFSPKQYIPPSTPRPQTPPPIQHSQRPEPTKPKGAEKDDSIIQTADTLYKEGRHQETLDLLKAHLKGEAARDREAFVLARAAANLGKQDEALADAQNAVETGMNGYASKPLDRQELTQTIQEFF